MEKIIFLLLFIIPNLTYSYSKVDTLIHKIDVIENPFGFGDPDITRTEICGPMNVSEKLIKNRHDPAIMDTLVRYFSINDGFEFYRSSDKLILAEGFISSDCIKIFEKLSIGDTRLDVQRFFEINEIGTYSIIKIVDNYESMLTFMFENELLKEVRYIGYID